MVCHGKFLFARREGTAIERIFKVEAVPFYRLPRAGKRRIITLEESASFLSSVCQNSAGMVRWVIRARQV
jgi:hypothetical protein